jgi:hypothetical protein
MARTKGSPNKATKAREQILSAAGLVPLTYMLKVLRDEDQPHEERMKAAIAAAPYVHPRLSTVQHQGDDDKPVAVRIIERRVVKAG